MILVEDGYSFNDLVNFAYNEIKRSITEDDYNLSNDFINDINWSEICSWCGFPDLQTSASIYEHAINVAIFHLMVHYKVDHKTIQTFVRDKILTSWSTKPISKKYESYGNGDNMCMFINEQQVNIPKEFYDAIKRGEL